MNLLQETIEILTANQKTPDDVRWVGAVPTYGDPYFGTWEQFEAMAGFDYDAGYGGNEVDSDLVVVGDDWWLERGENDGSEWWEFKTLPKPNTVNPMRASDIREK